MPIEIDGYAVLGAIARHPKVFAALRPEVIKTARSFVSKQLKDKALTHDVLVAIATALGAEALDLILDTLSDAEIKALLGKVDKLNAAIKTSPAPEQRKLLADLAHGDTRPAAKSTAPGKPPAPAREARPTVERSGNSKAMRAKKRV